MADSVKPEKLETPAHRFGGTQFKRPSIKQKNHTLGETLVGRRGAGTRAWEDQDAICSRVGITWGLSTHVFLSKAKIKLIVLLLDNG